MEVAEAIIKSFADDTQATKSIRDITDVESLQSDLAHIYNWSEANNMDLNDKKF